MLPARPVVAVIDDDLALMSLISEFLNDEGFEVVTVADERDAVDLVRGARPDVILLDVRMQLPDSGKHVLEQIREDPLVGDMPVIVTTADTLFLREHDEYLDDRRALALSKPFDLDDLLALVRRALNGSAGYPSSPNGTEGATL